MSLNENAIGKIIDGLYTSFIARDIVCKVIPGSFVVAGIILLIHNTTVYNRALKIIDFNFLFYIYMFCICWLLGFFCQGFANFFHLIYDIDDDDGKYYFETILFINITSAIPKFGEFLFKRYERFIIIKEACINSSIGIMWFVFFLIVHLSIQKGADSQQLAAIELESSFALIPSSLLQGGSLSFENIFSWPIILLFGVSLLIICILIYYHKEHCIREHNWRIKTIEYFIISSVCNRNHNECIINHIFSKYNGAETNAIKAYFQNNYFCNDECLLKKLLLTNILNSDKSM